MVWVRLDDRFDENPKIAAVGPLGVALWITGLAYCNRNLTDGFIPWGTARKLVAWEYLDVAADGHRRVVEIATNTDALVGDAVRSDDIIGLLVHAGLWDEAPGGYAIHDYAGYQPTRADVEAERAVKQAAGRAGGRASATARAKAGGQAGAKAPPQAESNPEPEPVPEASDEASSRAADDVFKPWGSELTQPTRDRVLELVNAIGPQFVDDETYAAVVQLVAEYPWDAILAARAKARQTDRPRPFPANIRKHLAPLPGTQAKKPVGPTDVSKIFSAKAVGTGHYTDD